MYTLTLIFVVVVVVVIQYYFAARNIPLRVNAEGGNMEMDVPDGEPPKTNEQADGLMR